jgi:hypothetical protein
MSAAAYLSLFFFVLRYLAVEENVFYLNVFPLEESHDGLKCQDRRRQVAIMKLYHMAGIKSDGTYTAAWKRLTRLIVISEWFARFHNISILIYRFVVGARARQLAQSPWLLQ